MNISKVFDEGNSEIVDIENDADGLEHNIENEGIQIFNTINKRIVVLGEELVYEIKVLNKNDRTIKRKLFLNMLPKAVEFIKNSVAINGTPLIGENPLNGILISSIDGKDVATVTFKVKIVEYISKINNDNIKIYLENTESREIGELSRSINEDTGFGNVEVLHAHLAVVKNAVKTAVKTEVSIGSEIEYSIDIYNDGSYTPGVLYLYEDFSDEVEIVEGGVSENGYVRTGVDLIKGMRLTVIPPGYQSTIKIKAILKKEPSDSILTTTSRIGYNFILKPSNIYSDYIFTNSNDLRIKIRDNISLTVKESEVLLTNNKMTEVATKIKALEDMIKKLLSLKNAEMTTGKITKNIRSQSLLIKIKNNGPYNECVRIIVKNHDGNGVADVRVCRCIEPLKTTNIILYDIPNVYEVTFEGLAFEMEVWIGERLNGKNSITKENKFIEGHLFGNKNLRAVK